MTSLDVLFCSQHKDTNLIVRGGRKLQKIFAFNKLKTLQTFIIFKSPKPINGVFKHLLINNDEDVLFHSLMSLGTSLNNVNDTFSYLMIKITGFVGF